MTCVNQWLQMRLPYKVNQYLTLNERMVHLSSTESTEGSANFQRKIGSLRFMDTSPEVRVGEPPNKEGSSDIFSPVLSGINKHRYTIVPKLSSMHSNNIPSFQ